MKILCYKVHWWNEHVLSATISYLQKDNVEIANTRPSTRKSTTGWCGLFTLFLNFHLYQVKVHRKKEKTKMIFQASKRQSNDKFSFVSVYITVLKWTTKNDDKHELLNLALFWLQIEECKSAARQVANRTLRDKFQEFKSISSCLKYHWHNSRYNSINYCHFEHFMFVLYLHK